MVVPFGHHGGATFGPWSEGQEGRTYVEFQCIVAVQCIYAVISRIPVHLLLVSVQASCPFKKLGRVVRPIQEVGAGHSTEGDGRGWPVIGLGIPTLQDNHNVKVLLLQCRARRDECLRPTWRALVRERVPARPRGPTDDVCEELR